MNANELRIGNIIGYLEVDLDNGNEVIKNYPCTINDIAEIERGNICNRYSHVPLTEEWLLRFGFEKIGGQLWDCNQVRGLYVYDEFTPLAYLNPIKHVHSLQNLYFALTGEELTLKQ